MRFAVFVLFFLSGAAGLIYEVAWSRSLGVVFGASHLAVTTVLAVYMGGQALGGAWLGRRSDRTARPLRLYAALELGVAISALAFLGVMHVFPSFYRTLARVSPDPVYLTAVRGLFSAAALIVPTTLMGGTLPSLSRFVTHGQGSLARRLSVLYALNTFGAVVGTLAAAFWLLRSLGVTATVLVAAVTSAVVGGAAFLLDARIGRPAPVEEGPPAALHPGTGLSDRVRKLALVGAGVSGFCALGYEVLWTRMLTLVVGTSVYSFAIMLAAFLSGIGLGSQVYAVMPLERRTETGRAHARLFAMTQVAIGATAGLVTVAMRFLPVASTKIQLALLGTGHGGFSIRLLGTGVLAFASMVVPAFFMGLAFPAAAAVWSEGRTDPGRAVGSLLLSNTIGAIAGSIAAGFLFIFLLGIERSLHLLVVANVAMGMAMIAGLYGRRWALWAVPALAAALVAVRVLFPEFGRVWDQKFFAAFANTPRDAASFENVREYLGDVEVLYYQEGVNETVSSVRTLGHLQTFIVNGRPEASTYPADVAVQRALGHLPMLLHRNPRRAFVLGTGTGMTLGSISVHPQLEHLVLAEIERSMLGVARTFERWNHRVLDNPRLQIVFNDGRNFLATTKEKFDVISADPIHPWSGGAGYLYTREYFQAVARRLDEGGIACQWLPLYELRRRDIRSVVRTWSEAFPHVAIWVTYYDAVLIGSKSPLAVDEAGLDRRIQAAPGVRADLEEVYMGTAKNLLEHFLMGDEGARDFARGGVVNTDDNLWLEFSAPFSQGVGDADGKNLRTLSKNRESLAVLEIAGLDEAGKHARWDPVEQLGRVFDVAHARHLLGRPSAEIDPFLSIVAERDPDYGPLKFLLEEREFERRSEPAPVAEEVFATDEGPLRVVAVRQFVARERVLLSFVDPARREIFGQRYVDGSWATLADDSLRASREVLAALRAAFSNAGPAAPRAKLLASIRAETRRLVGTLATGPAQ